MLVLLIMKCAISVKNNVDTRSAGDSDLHPQRWRIMRPGVHLVQPTQRTFCWTFVPFALLNDCSQWTFAERKQNTNWNVRYSEQRWWRPYGLFHNAKVRYIAQTMGDKGNIWIYWWHVTSCLLNSDRSVRRLVLFVANTKQNVCCTERSPALPGHAGCMSLWHTVKPVFKTTWEIGTTWELRTATSVPRSIY